MRCSSLLAVVVATTVLLADRAEANAVNLGTAANYAVLTKAGVTTTGVTSITGHLGVSPIAATGVTGFALHKSAGAPYSTSTLVAGRVYAASYAGSTAAALGVAVLDMLKAYNNAIAMVATPKLVGQFDGTSLGVANLRGNGDNGGASKPLVPGVYSFPTAIVAQDLYFRGSATDTFVIKAGGLVMQPNTRMVLQGGVLAENIVWQIGGTVELRAGAHAEGILLSSTSVAFLAGASLTGRVLSSTACTLISATIVQP